jgi:hypothetical protein
MPRPHVSAIAAATVLCFAAACSNNETTPLSPSTADAIDAQAAADGSTLKVTAPGVVSPQAGEQLRDPQPEFTVNNSQAKFAVSPPLVYRFELHNGGGLMASAVVPTGSERTTWSVPDQIEQDAYRWRARAEMGSRVGPWSEFVSFATVVPPSVLPRGPYPRNPEEIVRFVQRSYPDRGRANVSLGKRDEDMAFFRDRIIEVGLCVGLEMGRNLKRGGPELSMDLLAWKTGGRTWGVDIAGGYDAVDKPLVLSWRMHAPRAFFSPIPNPQACRN